MKVTLKFERDTKNKNVYQDAADGAPIPSLYIDKSAFGDKDPPKSITVTIPEIGK